MQALSVHPSEWSADCHWSIDRCCGHQLNAYFRESMRDTSITGPLMPHVIRYTRPTEALCPVHPISPAHSIPISIHTEQIPARPYTNNTQRNIIKCFGKKEKQNLLVIPHATHLYQTSIKKTRFTPSRKTIMWYACAWDVWTKLWSISQWFSSHACALLPLI